MKIVKKILSAALALCILTSASACSGASSNSSGSENKSESSSALENPAEGRYTFNTYISSVPEYFSPLSWQSENERYILDYTAMGLYEIDYNDEGDGYRYEPEMASAMPEDITAEYKGQYGYPADAESGYVFKIPLNENAVWQDGTAITADDWIYTMQTMLSSELKNSRASEYFSNGFVIRRAYYYYNQDKVGTDKYVPVADNDYKYASGADSQKYFSLSATDCMFFGRGYTFSDYYNQGYSEYYMDAEGNNLYDQLVAAFGDNEYVKIDQDIKNILTVIASNFGDENKDAYNEFCYYVNGTYESTSWEDVGFFKSGDFEITIMLAEPVSDFVLEKKLSELYLVNKTLVEKNGAESYATSTDTYASYGPFSLVKINENGLILEKNESWYGYTDGNHNNQWQATVVNAVVADSDVTALEMLMAGNIDAVSLPRSALEMFSQSEYAYAYLQPYTTSLTLNSDKDALEKRESEGINKKILSYVDFRKAVSMAVDRKALTDECTDGQIPGYGVFNGYYISDSGSGISYRHSSFGQNVLCEIYGVSDADNVAMDSATAAALFESAYASALEARDINETDTVEIEFLMYSSDDAYKKIYENIESSIIMATQGTSLEGRVKLTFAEDSDYYEKSYSGEFDMILTILGGAQMAPYSIARLYCDDYAACSDYNWGSDEYEISIEINGETVTKTFDGWYKALRDDTYSSPESETGTMILAAMEQCLLSRFSSIPLYYGASYELLSKRCSYNDEYVPLVEYGGTKYIRFSMDDAQWEQFVSEKNGSITY